MATPLETNGSGILGAVGGTPLVQLRKVVPPGSARVLAKLEWANPTGSMKDRMAVSVIEGAEARGEIASGDTVVEYTAGTTGISLAFVCAAKGYRLHAVFSDAFSDEKRLTMQAFGATVEDVPSDAGRITEQLIRAMIARAGELSRQQGHWWCDQLNNHDAISGYLPLGDEIWTQSEGRVDAFVQAVSTAHSIHGVARALRDPDEVDAIEQVTTEEAMAMSRRLAREEAIFAGTSSGANVVAAMRQAERLGSEATVVTIIVDSGLRYLSSDLFPGR